MSNSISNVYNFYKQVQEKVNSYTPPLSEEAIIRCLYLELGKMVGLNYTYYHSDAIKRWTMEQNGYSEVEGERERIVEKVLGDDTWIAMESEIAIAQEVVGKYLGVDIKAIKDESEKNKPRFFNLVTRRDGSQYRVNLAQDLLNIQLQLGKKQLHNHRLFVRQYIVCTFHLKYCLYKSAHLIQV